MKNCKIIFCPMNKEIEIPVGTPLKKAMDIAELDFDFPCGGRGRCGKCRLQILKGSVPPLILIVIIWMRMRSGRASGWLVL
ncbi:MAG: 2Fe-2S iron-sulfur cluster-binding protein [Syntrophaceticus schinkii]